MKSFFLKKYMLDLANNGTSDYFRNVFFEKDNGERLIGNISFFTKNSEVDTKLLSRKEYSEWVIDEIINKIEEVNALPIFFQDNNLCSQSSMGSIFLVGILDLLLRNVKKHSEHSDVAIKFDYSDSSSKTPFYSIEIVNAISKKNHKGNGVTNWFFDVLNNRAENMKELFFRIEMGPDGNKTNYVAKIIVYGSRKEN